MRREEKEQLVASLARDLRESGSVILADYRGLKVKEMSELRRALANAGGRMRVVKNTLLRRALEGQQQADLTEFLQGPLAVALGPEDPVPMLKEMTAFARSRQRLSLKAGWCGGRVFTGEQLAEMATLPPRNELLGQLVGVLAAPLTQLVGVLQAGPRDLVLTLQALARQREEQAGASASA